MAPRKTADPAFVRGLIAALLPAAARADSDPMLFGPGGCFDSLGLVNFLADLEYRIADEFGCDLVLASERAMSRTRSPFRTAATLTEYVMELLREEGH